MKISLLFLMVITITYTNAQNVNQKYGKSTADNFMIYLPSGTLNFVPSDSDYDPKKPSFISVKGFYLCAYEISNFNYAEYLYYLKRTDEAAYQIARPDTLVWKHKLTYCEPYVEYYFQHPAYRDYPMVGLTHAQCEKFCEWLTKIYNENPERKHKKVRYRLPTKNEWYYASVCKADEKKSRKKETDEKRVYNSYDALFPWGTFFLQNTEGLWLANFKPISQSSIQTIEGTFIVDGKEIKNRFYIGNARAENMGVAGNLMDASDVTAPVFSYWPNSMGFYNLAGNVEEFVAEYGITKGGSWNDTGYYLRNDVEESYDSTNEQTSARGFRLAMDVLEEW